MNVMDYLIPQDGVISESVDRIGTTLSNIFLLLQAFLSFLFKCDTSYAEEGAHEEEKEDWSAILVFIMIVKCRTTIGKILDADNDD